MVQLLWKTVRQFLKKKLKIGDFAGGLVAKTHMPNAEGPGSIPGPGARFTDHN